MKPTPGRQALNHFLATALIGLTLTGLSALLPDLIYRPWSLEGDRIESRAGHVWVNGQELNEPYLPPATSTQGLTPRTVPPGDYWVMGDNRSDSKDSRFFGPIPRSLIVGRAFIRVWPLGSLKWL